MLTIEILWLENYYYKVCSDLGVGLVQIRELLKQKNIELAFRVK